VFDNGMAIGLSAGQSVSRELSASARWPLLAGGHPFAAVIFDLDGVLTDTAMVHFHAWKRLADELGIAFDRTINRRLKGVDRMASLDILLERSGREFAAQEKEALAQRKNGFYRDEIARFTPADLLPGALAALDAVRAAGLRVGLASASRNAPMLLDRLGIADRFDFIADPAQVAAGKPDPAIFLAAAQGLGVPPQACLGIEDAAAGIAAIKAAGMTALGIGDRRELAGADAVLDDLHQFRIETIPVDGASGGGAARRSSGAAYQRVDTSDRTGTARIPENRD
jgi:alpha,alpha-trehalose phosphorylase